MVTFFIFTIYSKYPDSPHCQGCALRSTVVEEEKKCFLTYPVLNACLLDDVSSKPLSQLNLNRF